MRMYTYLGTLTLEENQEIIRFREGSALELVDCIVSTDKSNNPINTFVFKELRPGQVPEDIVLVEANAPKPGNTNAKVLTDVLVIEKQFKTIDFYR